MLDRFEDHCWKDVIDEETLGIYSAYRRELRIGERPAVLVVDAYKLSYEGGAKPVAELVKEYPSSSGVRAWAMVEPTQRVLKAAREIGLPVIYSTHDARSHDNETPTTKRQVNRVSATAFEILDELAPAPEDLIIYKQRASCFHGTPLLSHLTAMGIGSLVVCGGTTSGCLRAAVVDAQSYGFHVTVVEEGCYDRTAINHKVNLFDMHHKYADVMHIDDVLERLYSANDLRKAS